MAMASTPRLIWVFVATIFVMLITFYEWRISLLGKKIENLQLQTALLQQPPTPKIQPSPKQQEAYYPPIVSNNNRQLSNLPMRSIETIPQKSAIRDIFETPRSTADSETSIDKIKTRYEELLVTYLFLKKCGKTNVQDYQLIISSLQKELATINSPARLKYDILTAAKGSYDELYAHSDCQEASAQATLQKYNTYISSLSQK